MSERGSFVTEYLYCKDCLEACKKHLLDNEKHLCSQVIQSWGGGVKELPIIAGKIGGGYSGEELVTFEYELVPKIQKDMCEEHNIKGEPATIRIAVLADGGEEIFKISKTKVTVMLPDDEEEEPLPKATTTLQENCDACCKRPGLIYLSPEDISNIGESLDLTSEGVITNIAKVVVKKGREYHVIEITETQGCAFLDDGKCLVWENKPLQCSSYPHSWPGIIEEKEKEFCPGIGQGSQVEGELIEGNPFL